MSAIGLTEFDGRYGRCESKLAGGHQKSNDRSGFVAYRDEITFNRQSQLGWLPTFTFMVKNDDWSSQNTLWHAFANSAIVALTC